MLLVAGCTYTLTGGRRLTPDTNPHAYVGKAVTLHGKFVAPGKPGPYVQTLAAPVYLVPSGSPSCSSNYERFQDKSVSVRGRLHFRHFEPVAAGDAVDRPSDYFYLDAETAKIKVR